MAAPTGESLLAGLGAREAAAAAHALSLPPEAFGNDPSVEVVWAAKAFQHAEVYFNLISSVDPRLLKLTRADDQIYAEFREAFKDLKVDLLDEEDLKSQPAKEKWRPFCLQFDGVVEDFNYGTLLRLDCSKGYTEENTILATRIQFFAIEIARNREGYNCVITEAGKPALAQKGLTPHETRHVFQRRRDLNCAPPEQQAVRVLWPNAEDTAAVGSLTQMPK